MNQEQPSPRIVHIEKFRVIIAPAVKLEDNDIKSRLRRMLNYDYGSVVGIEATMNDFSSAKKGSFITACFDAVPFILNASKTVCWVGWPHEALNIEKLLS